MRVPLVSMVTFWMMPLALALWGVASMELTSW